MKTQDMFILYGLENFQVWDSNPGISAHGFLETTQKFQHKHTKNCQKPHKIFVDITQMSMTD
jgi:hypothetical protein